MSQDNAKGLRQALGKFATGVTVVTCQGAMGPCGITANSFSSVSLDPPLVLWNIAKVSHSLQAYLVAEHFAVNVLGAGQREISHHFAQADHTRFNGIEYDVSEHGVPLIPGSVACFECRTHQVHDCGDHYIIIGEVDAFRCNGDEPLLFYSGAYAALK